MYRLIDSCVLLLLLIDWLMQLQGNCFLWGLARGNNGTTQLNFQTKLTAHQKYALKCQFSPDATWVLKCFFVIGWLQWRNFKFQTPAGSKKWAPNSPSHSIWLEKWVHFCQGYIKGQLQNFPWSDSKPGWVGSGHVLIQNTFRKSYLDMKSACTYSPIYCPQF